MLTFRLARALANPNDPDWRLLADHSFKGPVHSDRLSGFLLSREALRLCLEARGVSALPRTLTLKCFDELDHYSDFTISLSHTAACGAALIADRQTYRAIGIDVEHDERVVKENIRERIAHTKDIQLKNIELWCLKEAVFKVLMNAQTSDRPVEFSSIRIGDQRWFHTPSGSEGVWELERIKPYVVARAWQRN
jgi:hypothetical protein